MSKRDPQEVLDKLIADLKETQLDWEPFLDVEINGYRDATAQIMTSNYYLCIGHEETGYECTLHIGVPAAGKYSSVAPTAVEAFHATLKEFEDDIKERKAIHEQLTNK